MSIVIVGGLDRLKRIYEQQGKKLGFKVKVFGRRVPALGKRISRVDGIVVFTSMVSHHILDEVNRCARLNKIPIIRVNTSSVSGLKRCLAEFIKYRQGQNRSLFLA